MVLSPDETHESVAVDVVTAGMAVYVENPVAITVDGCDRMLRIVGHGGEYYFKDWHADR